MKEVLFILGPSGAGKTTLASSLGERLGWFHADFDHGPESLRRFGLEAAWNEFFYRLNPLPLLEKIKELSREAPGAAFSFSSLVILAQEHISLLRGVRVVYLSGSEERCLDSFLAREQCGALEHTADFWRRHNIGIYNALRNAALLPHQVPVFGLSGERRAFAEIFSDIEKIPFSPAPRGVFAYMLESIQKLCDSLPLMSRAQ